MPDVHIAQMNVATALYPLTDPRMQDFVDRLSEINELADGSPGFVWRLQDDSGNATGIRTGEDPRFIVNMSVWDSVEALFAFVYRSSHTGVMVQRRRWFVRPSGAYQVLWWVPAGHRPTVEEGLERLRHLEDHGPSERAFTFKRRFPPSDGGGPVTDMVPERYCSGWA